MNKHHRQFSPSPLQAAMEHHRAGRLQQAESLYKKHAGNADAMHLLGLLYHESGRHAQALDAIAKAISLQPGNATYYFSIEAVYRVLQRLPEALARYRLLLDISPGNVPVLVRLGHALRDAGQLSESLASYLAVLELQPQHAEAYSNMGDTLKAMGKLDEAESCYKTALQLHPAFAEVHNNLGTLYQSREQWELSTSQFRQALALRDDFAAAHYNLGVSLQQLGALPDALDSYSRAVALNPHLSEAYNNMGIVCRDLNSIENAVACYQAALEIRPSFAEALNNLGGAYHDQMHYTDAISQFEHALSLQPDYDEAYLNLGGSYLANRQHREALLCLQQAIHLKPDYAEAQGMLAQVYGEMGQHEQALALCAKISELWPDSAAVQFNLGTALGFLQRRHEAAEAFRQAIARKPEFTAAYNSLGELYRLEGRYEDALQQYATALELRPDFAAAHNNLALVFKDQGKLDDARLHFERAIELAPDCAIFYHNLLLTMQYSPNISKQALFDLHLRFGKQFEPELLAQRLPHLNARTPSKRLKIGYVSGDFRRHAVSCFIEAVLAEHDKSAVELYCYYNNNVEDAVTRRIKATADHWLPCNALSDEQLAQRIRDDGIDILIDLSGHTAHNRLLVFGHKPAPVQASYLGYAATTGLTAIDYRITDLYAEPPGECDRLSTERLWRLPDTVSCYAVQPGGPAVIDHPPRDDNGHITFGCFNNYTKLSDQTIRLWARILQRVPDARLMLEITGLERPDYLASVTRRLQDLGLDPARLILVPRADKNQFVLYNRIDIALDPFPYNGGTTSFDTLWMGVPFISLAGSSFTSRLGVTILQNGGLGELIACSEDEYVEIASALALDTPRLRAMRDDLRGRITASPLMDVPRFTRQLEQAYREMWAIWCTGEATSEH